MEQMVTVVMFGAVIEHEALAISAHSGPSKWWNPKTEAQWLLWAEGSVYGFVVAVLSDGYQIDGVPCLRRVGAVCLDDLPTTAPFAQAIELARGWWEEFSDRAALTGVCLPEGRLYLTEIEVG